jgi:hypothetical protein
MKRCVPGATISLVALALLFGASPGTAQVPTGAAGAARSDVNAELDRLRRTTERFRDVRVALAEGYLPDPTGACMTAAMEGLPRQLGAMGIHYFRPDLLGITTAEPRVDGIGTHLDFGTPGILIYEPQPDGSLSLVAIENLVFQKAWKQKGNESPPAFLGNEYYLTIDNPLTPMDEAHGFEPHYELHVWIHRENPSGVFAPFNPAVTCEHHQVDPGHPHH